jgi:hypothetical protein
VEPSHSFLSSLCTLLGGYIMLYSDNEWIEIQLRYVKQANIIDSMAAWDCTGPRVLVCFLSFFKYHHNTRGEKTHSNY